MPDAELLRTVVVGMFEGEDRSPIELMKMGELYSPMLLAPNLFETMDGCSVVVVGDRQRRKVVVGTLGGAMLCGVELGKSVFLGALDSAISHVVSIGGASRLS